MIRALVTLGILAAAIWALTLGWGGAIAIAFVIALLFLAYKSQSLLPFTATFGVLLGLYTWLGEPHGIWKGFLWALFIVLALFNLGPIRKGLITAPFLKVYKRMLPSMSQTEPEIVFDSSLS